MPPRLSRLAAAALSLSLLFLPLPGLAQNLDLGLVYASGLGLPGMDIRDVATSLIRCALALAGFIMILRILQGGLQMITDGGSAEGRSEAIETIKSGVIGMLILMTSAAVVRFVVAAVVNASSYYLT